MPTWYAVTCIGETAEITLYDEIGAFGINAKQFLADLEKIKKVKNLDIRINSPGGNVFDGNAIFNALSRLEADKNVYIDGLAASMASVIAMAGDRIHMADNALFMIHNPSGFVIGGADDMRKTAGVLDKIKNTLVATYAKRTGLDETDISEYMDNETWFDAEEAKAFQFIDEVTPGIDVENRFDVRNYPFHNIPQNYLKQFFIAAQASKPTKETPMPKPSVPGPVDNDPQAALDQATQAGIKREAERRQAIEALFQPFGDDHNDLLKTCLNDLDCKVDTAKDKLLNALGKGSTPLGREPEIQMVEDRRDKFLNAAQNAIEIRAGMQKTDKRDNEYLSYSLFELARQSLAMHNHAVKGMSKMELIGAAITHSTGDFPHILGNTANKSLLRGFEDQPENYSVWTRRGNLSDFKIHTRVQWGLFDDLDHLPEGTEYKHGSLEDIYEQIRLFTFGKKFTITRQAIINDDLDMFTGVPRRMGGAARRKIGDLAYLVLTANKPLSDGVPVFDAKHHNIAKKAGPPSVDTVGEVRYKMGLQRDPGNHSELNIEPVYLICPRALEDTANTLRTSEYHPEHPNNTRIPNPRRNQFQIVTDARLDRYNPASWFMAANPDIYDTVEVAFLDGQDTPVLEQQRGWDVDGVEFKVRLDVGAKAMGYHGLFRNPGKT